jgi:hypothetical protein
MKSGLEKYCYKRLEEEGFEFGYETQTFTVIEEFYYEGAYHSMTNGSNNLIDKTAKKVRGIKYTPDFILPNDKIIIETKGYIRSQHSFPLRFKLFLSYLNRNGMGDWGIFLIKNQKQVNEAIQIIKNDQKRT